MTLLRAVTGAAALRAGAWLTALLLAVSLTVFTGYRPFYFLLYFGALLLAVSYLWSWAQTRGLEAQVESLSARPQVGYPLQVRVTVREKLGIPRLGLRVRLVDVASQERDFLLDLGPKAVREWTVHTTHHRRGPNVIGALEVSSTGPLGLGAVRRPMGTPQTITVYPQVIPLIRGMILGNADLGDLLRRASRRLGTSAAASRVREYTSSDSLNRIHWPSTARTGRLMSKEFDSGGHNEVWLILDLQESRQAGKGLESTEEYAVTVAASLAAELTDAGQRVALMAHGERVHALTPDPAADYKWRLLDALAVAKAKGNVSLLTVLERAARRIPQGSLAVIIAPGPLDGGDGSFTFMRRRGVSVTPALLDAQSFRDGPPSNGAKPIPTPDDGCVIRRGDHLPHVLADLMDRLAG